MRKHKSVVAILLAVMMIFTFMPAMAFANVDSAGADKTDGGTPVRDASQIHWGDNYDSVAVDNFNDGNAYTGSYIVRKMRTDTDRYYRGVIKAGLNSDKFSTTATYPTIENVYYIDLSTADLAIDGEMSQSDFNDLFDQDTGYLVPAAQKMVFKIPDYDVDTANRGKAATASGVNLPSGWKIIAKKPASYVDKAETAQTVTIEATVEANGAANGTLENPYVINQKTFTKQIKVQGKKADLSAIKFYKDTVKVGSEAGTLSKPLNDATCTQTDPAVLDGISFPYDAKAHKVVTNEVNGYKVSWLVLNKTNGKYEPATECPSVTEVKDSTTDEVMAVVSWTTTSTSGGSTTTTTHNAYVKVPMTVTGHGDKEDTKTRPSFSFDPNGNYKESYVSGGVVLTNDKYMYSVAEGESYDPYDFVVVNPGATKVDSTTYTVTEADKATAAAKEAELKAYFKEFYEIKKATKKAYPGYEFWTIVKRTDLNATEIAAVNKKYSALLNAFGAGQTEADRSLYRDAYFDSEIGLTSFGPGQSTGGNATMYTIAVQNTKDDDISFEGQTKFVYSGKKTTKKGVLKAKKTITVNATADSGNAMTFTATKTTSNKITVNKTTGKITVKKGLKKGTYKVTVKAKTAAGNGYKACKATQTYTIVIKK